MASSGPVNRERRRRREQVGELILRFRRMGITDKRVLAAIEAVPRDLFVPAESRNEAYSERALPIDCGQTISAPVIVAMMTAALDLGADDRVLEIGTGSGYQTAVLANLCRHVYTIDRFRTLVEAAQSRFRTLRLSNVTILVGDGMLGWPEEAPFDRIAVTAAADPVPPPLIDQLADGGVMVVPVGPQEGIQTLKRIVRRKTELEETDLADVRFVPLIPGKAAHL